MKVLMTSWAWPSHYLPMVPLGWALRAAGHEVRVASQPALAPVITDSGQVAVATGPDLDHSGVHRRVMGGLGLDSVPHAPAPGATMAGWRPDSRDRVRRVFAVFAAYSEAMLDDLWAYARAWRPDLVVFDPTTMAGPVVAAALGVPAVRHIHGVDVTYQARDVVADLMAPLSARLGLGVVDPLGTATVDPCPPSMQSPAEVTRLTTRYVPYNGPAVLPDWLREPPRRPRVCLTWGTSTTRIAGRHLFAPPVVLAGLRDLDLDVVVTVTGADADLLTDLAPNVRVVRALPLHLLLPHCAAIVHQGGNGTLLTGAWHGRPQLVLPQLPDQTFHTGRFVATGAGLSLAPDEVTPASVRAAVTDLLGDPSYAAAATRLRAEMAATPPPARLVPRLAALAGAAV
jgi:UDP:flavonoid glycosyltransferase YjiC (YdhE family)